MRLTELSQEVLDNLETLASLDITEVVYNLKKREWRVRWKLATPKVISPGYWGRRQVTDSVTAPSVEECLELLRGKLLEQAREKVEAKQKEAREALEKAKSLKEHALELEKQAQTIMDLTQ